MAWAHTNTPAVYARIPETPRPLRTTEIFSSGILFSAWQLSVLLGFGATKHSRTEG
jgi:hypothetical protein